MGPVVSKLAADYADRVEVRRIEVDKLSKDSPDFPAIAKMAEAVHFNVTPTFLVLSKKGEVHGRYEGVTSYATLSRDLENELKP
jgi:protein-disulfide isomerase